MVRNIANFFSTSAAAAARFSATNAARLSPRFNLQHATTLESQVVVQQRHVNLADAVGKIVKVRRSGNNEQYLTFNIRTGTFTSKDGRKFDHQFHVRLFSQRLIEQARRIQLNTTVFVQGSVRYFNNPILYNNGAIISRTAEIVAEKIVILEKPMATEGKPKTAKRFNYY